MPSQLYDLVVEIHREAAKSLDGTYTLSEASVDDEERKLIEQAAHGGLINLRVKDDFGDYFIMSLTTEGRREFNLPEVKRKPLWARLLAMISSGITSHSR
ncbi:hypothetical protein [Rhizobium yanglingense]